MAKEGNREEPAVSSKPVREEPLSLLTEALRGRRLLLVWADMPSPPEERPPRNPALAINRWQGEARSLSAVPWPLAQLPPLSTLSLDPTDRIEAAFRQAGVPLNVVRTRRDLPARDRHNLLKLGGDLAARAGLLLSWDDVRAAPNDPDKAHLLREASRLAQDSTVLVLAPSPTAAFTRLWRELVTPALQGATHHLVLGPAEFAWPAPLVRLDVQPEVVLATLAGVVIPQPVDPGRVGSLRHQLAEARANLRLIEERESEYVLSTDVPLQLVKEKRRWQRRIAELETQLTHAGASAAEAKAVTADSLPPEEIRAIHEKLDRLLAGQEDFRRGQAGRISAARHRPASDSGGGADRVAPATVGRRRGGAGTTWDT